MWFHGCWMIFTLCILWYDYFLLSISIRLSWIKGKQSFPVAIAGKNFFAAASEFFNIIISSFTNADALLLYMNKFWDSVNLITHDFFMLGHQPRFFFSLVTSLSIRMHCNSNITRSLLYIPFGYHRKCANLNCFCRKI